MNYTSVFGGGTVYPAPLSLATYTLTASQSLQLQWALDNFPANSNVLARINQFNASGAGATVLMPTALNASLGEVGLFVNTGANTFTIATSTGVTICGVPAGTAYYVYLTDNTTASGTWNSFQFASFVSQANAAALAGYGLAATGSTLSQVMPVTALSGNYTMVSGDRDKFFNYIGGGGSTFTLPSAPSVGSDFYVQVRNSGTGSLAIALQAPDLINGASSITFNLQDSAFIVTDGTNWYTLGYGVINTNVFNFQVVNLTGITGTYVLPSNLQNKVAYRFTGVKTGLTNISVPATIQQYWVDNETTDGFALNIGTATQIAGAQQLPMNATQRYIFYCDGVNVLNADTQGLTVPVSIVQGGTGATTAGQALINLGGTSLGISLFTAASQSAAVASLGVLTASDATAFAMGF